MKTFYLITHPNVVISRDVPPNGGGNYYRFTLSPRAAHFWRRAFDG